MIIDRGHIIEIFAPREGGYFIQNKYLDGSDDIDNIQHETIASEDDDKKEFEELVYKLAELLSVGYDKWKVDNLNIKWDKKGHKAD